MVDHYSKRLSYLKMKYQNITLIEEEIREQLYNIMVKSVDNDEEELDFRYLFDHENDYIDILKSNLLNVSHRVV